MTLITWAYPTHNSLQPRRTHHECIVSWPHCLQNTSRYKRNIETCKYTQREQITCLKGHWSESERYGMQLCLILLTTPTYRSWHCIMSAYIYSPSSPSLVVSALISSDVRNLVRIPFWKTEPSTNLKFDIRSDGFPTETACNQPFISKWIKVTLLALNVQIKECFKTRPKQSLAYIGRFYNAVTLFTCCRCCEWCQSHVICCRYSICCKIISYHTSSKLL